MKHNMMEAAVETSQNTVQFSEGCIPYEDHFTENEEECICKIS